MFEENGGQWRPLSGNDNAAVLIKKSVKNANYDWDARRRDAGPATSRPIAPAR